MKQGMSHSFIQAAATCCAIGKGSGMNRKQWENNRCRIVIKYKIVGNRW